MTAVDIRETDARVARNLTVDLREKDAIEDAAAVIGPIDAFFNCAGVAGPPFSGGAALSPVDTMVVNVVGPRHLIELVIPSKHDGSAIAYVASASGFAWKKNLESLMPLVSTQGFDAGSYWCEANREVIDNNASFVSKEAINASAAWRSLSLIRDHGIRLNCSNPGSMTTPMMEVFRGLMPDPPSGPIGRMSTPERPTGPSGASRRTCSPT